MNTRKNARSLLLAGVFLALAVVACNLSGTVEETEVATTEAAPTPAQGGEVQPTQPPQPAATPAPVPDIAGPGGCTLNGAFVEDVTIPDGTELPPGKSFTKTWRMRNTGTCPWKAGTKLVFVSGDQMGGQAAVPVGPVAPGSGAAISVDLVSPSSPGMYKGNWQLQSPDSTNYGSVIFVQIVVPSAPVPTPAGNTPPPPTPLPTLTPGPSESHVTIPLDAVNSHSGNAYNQARPGDDPNDQAVAGYLSWDIQSYIPAGAEIVSAEIVWATQCFRGGDYGDCTGTRNPFPVAFLNEDRLGYLEIQHYYHGTVANPATVLLDPSLVSPFEVYVSQPTGALDVTDKVSDDFGDGDPFQLRITFQNTTYDSGIGNGITFVEVGTGPNRLEVTYRMP
jgi:hypothetical protein